VFGPIFKGIGLAASPKGRRAIRTAVVFAQTEEGRRLLAEVRRAAASPEGRRLVDHAMKAAAQAGKTAGAPEHREWIRQTARTLRDRGR
jgi:hypothetical protein